MKKRLLSMLLVMSVVFTTCFGMTCTSYAADQGELVNVELTIDDSAEPTEVKAYYASYTFNTYVSLEDLAWALRGTEKNFDIQLNEDNRWEITTGVDYAGEQPELFATESIVDPNETNGISFDAYTIVIDGRDYELRMYDNYKYSSFGGDVKGVYMRLIDAGMFLNLAFDIPGYGEMTIDTTEDFVLDIEAMEEQEYFHDLDGALIGNATTGEVLYTWDADHATEIASTSKMMTMLIVLDAIEAGELAMDTVYTVSNAVNYEALSEDGTLYTDRPSSGKVLMKVGQTWTIADLLAAMMLPSANEAATALAEAVTANYDKETNTADNTGTEAAFVKLMNEKAAELGLDTAKFYNPHGLPNYTNGQYTGKRQNHMSANDMFTLVSALLNNHYEDVTAITGTQRIYLTSLQDDEYKDGVTYGASEDYTYTLEDGTTITAPYVNTTFGTLFTNFDNLIGMKTGSTNRSGSCIVAAVEEEINGEPQALVAISFGGEDNRQRYESSTVMLKYAQQYYAEKAEKDAKIKAGVEATTIKASAKASGDAIKVSWTKSKGYKVDAYEVYRATSKNGEYKKIATTTKTSITNTAKNVTDGKAYYYKVVGKRDVAGDNVYTKESNIASAKTKVGAVTKDTAITAKAKAYNDAVKVSWTKENTGFKVDGYKVYRSTSGKKGSFKCIKTTKAVSWKNSGLKDGKKYYYKVKGYRVVDGKTVFTEWSNTISKTTK